MNTIDIFTAISSVATAIGVVFVAWQLRISKKQAQAQFEDSFDQQYRNLSLPIPVDIFLGKEMTNDNREKVRELLFNYFDLCNEQSYLRSIGRITKSTWKIWCSGMENNLNTVAFKEVYNEVKGCSRFTYLDRLVQSEFKDDPKNK